MAEDTESSDLETAINRFYTNGSINMLNSKKGK
jgi:hypothetical protein